MRTLISATVTVPGLHHWPGAHDARDYLRAPHRHLFHVTATLEVAHDERDVEWHDLAEQLMGYIDGLASGHRDGLHDFDARSCETLARQLAHRLMQDDMLVHSVEWSEDGEFTARVQA